MTGAPEFVKCRYCHVGLISVVTDECVDCGRPDRPRCATPIAVALIVAMWVGFVVVVSAVAL